MCVAVTAIAWSAAAQDAPVRLTLDEAVARGLTNSQRLAELQARQEGAEAAVAGRGRGDDAGDCPQAGYTRTNHVEPFAHRPAATGGQDHLSGRPRQLPHADRPAVADLYRRPHRRAGTRGARGARRRGRGSGRGARRPPPRNHAGVLGARHRPGHRAGRRAFAREPRRARARPASQLDRGSFRPTRCCRPKPSTRASACSRSRRGTPARSRKRICAG